MKRRVLGDKSMKKSFACFDNKFKSIEPLQSKINKKKGRVSNFPSNYKDSKLNDSSKIQSK